MIKKVKKAKTRRQNPLLAKEQCEQAHMDFCFAKTRRIGMAVWKISEDVFYVGVNDTTLDLFESQYRITAGVK